MCNTISFDKVQTNALKGIAIIMLLTHHNFRKISLFENYNISFFPFSVDYIVSLSLFFKTCVSLFVFISGYGLYLSYHNRHTSTKNWVMKRWAKLMAGYWIVYIISLILTQLLNQRPVTVYFEDGNTIGIFHLLIDFFGLSNLFATESINPTWWYMSIAILFIFTLPIFVKIEDSFGAAALLLLSIAIPRIFRIEYKENSFITFYVAFVLGLIFAKYNIVNRWINFKSSSHIFLSKAFKCILELLLIIFGYYAHLRLPSNNFWEFKFGIIPVVIVLFCSEFIVTLPGIKSVLYYLGLHSMNIFLIHTFIRGFYMIDFTYSLRHFVLITFVLLMISLLLSIILERIKSLIKYEDIANHLANFLTRSL